MGAFIPSRGAVVWQKLYDCQFYKKTSSCKTKVVKIGNLYFYPYKLYRHSIHNIISNDKHFIIVY